MNKEGFTRVRVNKEIIRTDEKLNLERYKKSDIEVVIDRMGSTDISRIVEAVEKAVMKSDGMILVLDEKEKEHIFSAKLACPVCGHSIEELQPRLFSFNSPFGACESCNGLGVKMDFDQDLIIPDRSLSISDNAIGLYKKT